MPLSLSPPLLNSASPWATSIEDLEALFDCPFTGAVTTRTCTRDGFSHDGEIHQHCFFDSKSHSIQGDSSDLGLQAKAGQEPISSLNTYGYSPIPLSEYLDILTIIATERRSRDQLKPVIVSITGSPETVSWAVDTVKAKLIHLRTHVHPSTRLLVELNLSCPNIKNRPPPAYSMDQLSAYLLQLLKQNPPNADGTHAIEIGIKLPPYTYEGQFDELINLLKGCEPCPLAFITSTNTLGSSLVLAPNGAGPALGSESGTGLGGLAGSSLHPLALGNVATLRRKLDEHAALRGIEIIGVGGVSDTAGYKRMRAVGAAAVGVGTAVGWRGVGCFREILGERG